MMERPSFADGLGCRVPGRGTAGERLESLRLCAEVGDSPVVQAALVERAAGLSDFQHPSFARVRRIERFTGIARGLVVVSEAPEGIRLSDLLRQAERRAIEPGLDARLSLLHSVVAAVGALHAHCSDASHGAIGPERIVIAPTGAAMVVEHVLARALEELQLSRARLWELFRVPVPSVAGTVRFDQRTDVLQLGVLALSLGLGRVLLRAEYPNRLAGLLDEAGVPPTGGSDARGSSRPDAFPRPVATWVARALQLDSRAAFRNAIEAQGALAAALVEARRGRPSVAAVRAFLAECSAEVFSSPGADALPAPGPRGATVFVGAPPDATTRIPSRAPDIQEPDRGSGAHRVLRDGLVAGADPAEVHVLVDLSPAPPGDRGLPRSAPPRPADRSALRAPVPRPSPPRSPDGARAWRLGFDMIALAFRRK